MTSFENEIELLLTQAEELLQTNHPAEALSYLDRASKIQPRNGWAMLFRGVALLQLARNDEAVAAIIAAADDNKQDIDIQVDAARHLSTLEHAQDALICAKRALSINEFDAGAHAVCADALEELERFEEAVQHRIMAVANDDEDFESRYNLAADLCELSRFEEAIHVAQPLFDSFSDDPDVIRLKGACLSFQGEHFQALNCWAQLERIEGISSGLLLNRAYTLDIIGQYHEALATINEAIDMDMDEPLHYYSRGIINEHLHDDAAAINDYLLALSLDPESIDTVHNLLDLAISLNIAPLVLERIRLIFPGNPPYATIRYIQGCLLLEMGRLKSALRKIKSAVSLEPSFGIGWYSLILLYGLLDDPEGMLSASEYALRYYADDPMVRFHRGLANHEMKNYHQALEEYDKTVKLGDESMVASIMMARIMLFHLERPKNARGLLREIIHQQPENYSALWMLTLASLKLADYPQAKKSLTKLLEASYEQHWGSLLRATLKLPIAKTAGDKITLPSEEKLNKLGDTLFSELTFEMIFGELLIKQLLNKYDTSSKKRIRILRPLSF